MLYNNVQKITIPAGTAANPGRIVLALPGSFLLISSASAAFQLQLDNGGVLSLIAGFKIKNTPWTQLTFLNPASYPINVGFYYGSSDIDFSGIIQSQNLPTYALGNLGLQANGVYNGGGVAQNIVFSGGAIALQAGQSLAVYGVNNGNTRKTITLSYAGSSPVIINDANGNGFATLGSTGQVFAFDTASTLILQRAGGGGPWLVQIGEIYYAA